MFTKPFSQLNTNSSEIAGGKGASLGEMINANIPVPNGFVILSNAFQKFIETNDLNVQIDAILEKVNHNDINTVNNASINIQQLILNTNFPKDMENDILNEFEKMNCELVAVRSSATAEDGKDHAWAGQLNSYLNTTNDNLLLNVKNCFASLFTPRAIFYRFEKELHKTKISVAVVVQKMIQSEVSGIAFSVHPITEDYNQILIEAGYGLGEAIVSGQITPDAYTVHKNNLEIIDKNISSQKKGIFKGKNGDEWVEIEKEKQNLQKLTYIQIIELTKLIIQIENHYGFPCDIEWGLENNIFYILQSRPITTLSNKIIIQESEIIFTKSFTREAPLFTVFVWDISNKRDFDMYIPNTNIKNMLYVLRENSLIDMYYDNRELASVFQVITNAINNDEKVFDKIVEDFHKYTDIIFPYFRKEKTINNLAELEEFYINYIKWWSPMAFTFVIPEQPNIKEEIKQKALKMREETQEYSDEGKNLCKNFLEKHYPKFAELLPVLTPDEIFNIENLTDEQITEIKKRKVGVVLLTVNSESEIFPLNELSDKLKKVDAEIYVEKIVNSNSIKGTIACKGFVKGVAKVILTKKDLANIQDGDIMVTYATSPDYVPYMKKCSGIITDEGGSVCHAAIVSRELNIPCIVGTKNSTAIIKNGDILELDATNGVVTIENIYISEDDYDFLWRVYTWFPFTYLLWESGYQKGDFIFTYENGEYFTFVSKKERGKLSKRTLKIYTKSGCEKYYIKSKKISENVKVEFEKLAKIDLTKLSNGKLASKFLKMRSQALKLLKVYFLLEYHSMDMVAKKVLEEDVEIKSNAQFLGEFKLEMRAVWGSLVEDNGLLPKLLEETGKRLGIGKRADLFTIQELCDGLKKLNTDFSLNRNEGYVWGQKIGTPKIGREATEIIKELWKVDGKIETLTGQIAQKGFYKGKVKKIDYGDYDGEGYLTRKIEAMEKGDVLVVGSTSPEFMIACKKAGAIITDEGGVISHAAIISRELKIPCIIGTKYATHTLNDGDIVEVDANNGIVNIYKK